MTQTIINNRVNYDNVESDLVYPLDKGYRYICQVDKDWMRSKLRMRFGRQITDISNKYAVSIDDRLYTNHDGVYWLIAKPDTI